MNESVFQCPGCGEESFPDEVGTVVCDECGAITETTSGVRWANENPTRKLHGRFRSGDYLLGMVEEPETPEQRDGARDELLRRLAHFDSAPREWVDDSDLYVKYTAWLEAVDG